MHFTGQGNARRGIYTPTLPEIVPQRQGRLSTSPSKHQHVMGTPSLPDIGCKPDNIPRSPCRYPMPPMAPHHLPDLRGNRPMEINKARYPYHVFVDEPVEWKVERAVAANFVEQRMKQSHQPEIPPPPPTSYPANVEAARIQAAQRISKEYVDEIRNETSHHFRLSEDELREIELDRQRSILLERKDIQAEFFRRMKASKQNKTDADGMLIPSPPAGPRPSGSNGSVRTRKVKKGSKKKHGDHEKNF
ncbi:hypothetical protein ACF0H5_023859 [Mactra antiquata]